MMKIIIISLCLLLGIVSGMAQGIKFENSNWEQVVKKAQKENKLIFIDCYTSWCGPCKRLAGEVFIQTEVGDYFNSKFVNAKFDMEKEDGIELKKKFEVAAYPTLLFVSPGGEVVHRMVGGMAADALIRQGELAQDPEKNFASLQKRYVSGDRTPAFLQEYIRALDHAYLLDFKNQVVEEYLSVLPIKELLTKENWPLLKENVKNPLAPAFQQLVLGRQILKGQVGDKEVDNHIYVILRNQLNKMRCGELAFDAGYNEKFVQFLQRVTYEKAPIFLVQLYALDCEQKGEYRGMVDVIRDIFKYNLMQANDRSDCLIAFLNKLQKCKDSDLLDEVCVWIGQMVQKEKDPYQQVCYKDLQYNLLLTSGKKEEAMRVKAEADRMAQGYAKQYKREIIRNVVSI